MQQMTEKRNDAPLRAGFLPPTKELLKELERQRLLDRKIQPNEAKHLTIDEIVAVLNEIL